MKVSKSVNANGKVTLCINGTYIMLDGDVQHHSIDDWLKRYCGVKTPYWSNGFFVPYYDTSFSLEWGNFSDKVNLQGIDLTKDEYGIKRTILFS